MLKVNHGRTPLLMVFEILENFRIPFRVAPSRKKKGKGYNRVFLLSWWRQYSQIMKWFRGSCKRKSVRALIAWDKQLLTEFELLVGNSPQSQVYKKRMSVLQLSAAGRVYSHYRWSSQGHNAFASRGVKELYVRDRALAGTKNKVILAIYEKNAEKIRKQDKQVHEHVESSTGFSIADTWGVEQRVVAGQLGFRPPAKPAVEVPTKQKKKKYNKKRK